MRNRILYFMPLILMAFLSVSCVSKKKYLHAMSRAERLQSDSLDTHTKLEACNSTVYSLQNDKGKLQSEKGQLQNEKGNLESENQQVINELNKLSSSSKMTIADQARRLKAMQDLIQQQKDAMNNLKSTLATALVNFNSDDFSINIKDGKVYVSLQEKLLFKSGKADVDPKGKEALEKLASVLKSTADINVVIEGHTDNVPIKTPRFEDNWELSVARATAIVRLLTSDGMDPNRLTASGRGEYEPVATNESADGRQSNRRTEIVVSPNLTKLFNLANQ